MEEKIKLKFQNEEKEIINTPKSYVELKQLFHQLFPEAKKNYNYVFLMHQNEEKIIMTQRNFRNDIEEILDMDEQIIYVNIQDNNDDIIISDDDLNDNADPISNNPIIESQNKNINDKEDEEFELANKEEEEQNNIGSNPINQTFYNGSILLKNQLNDINQRYKEEIEQKNLLQQQLDKIININEQNQKKNN